MKIEEIIERLTGKELWYNKHKMLVIHTCEPREGWLRLSDGKLNIDLAMNLAEKILPTYEVEWWGDYAGKADGSTGKQVIEIRAPRIKKKKPTKRKGEKK